MDSLLNEIVKRPNLSSIVKELQEMLEEEKKLRREFYNTITEDDKVEFINGEVIMHSPVRRIHGMTMIYLVKLISTFVDEYNLGETDAEKRMIELSRNSYEPDIVFFKKEKTRHFKDDQMLFPAPDLIIEILSPGTEKIDRGIKYEDYALHGVEEYWIVDPKRKTIEQYLLKRGKYILEFMGANGVITSKVLKGFSMNTKAAFNKKENIKALQELMKN